MHRHFIITAAIMGGLAVLLGAFGAHGLKAIASELQLNTYETAVKYQFYHSFALLFTGIIYREYPAKGVITAGKLFIAGVLVFSGSLYLMTGLTIAGMDQFKWLGAITPLGGVLLVVAWVLLGISVKGYKP